MSELRTNRIVPRDGLVSGTYNGGGIIQVKQTVKTDVFSSNTSSFHDITGMSVSITPTRSDSKVLIQVSLSYGGQDNMYAGINLVRGSTTVIRGDAGTGSNTRASFGIGGDNNNFQYKLVSATFTYLDSPATTSATTYKLQGIATGSSSPTQYYLINSPYKSVLSSDTNAYIIRGTSTITAMEISG